MDPNAAWREMLTALASGDEDDAVGFASGLLEWLAKGGFPPRTSPDEGLTRQWHVEVAQAVCRLAIEHARAHGLAKQGATE